MWRPNRPFMRTRPELHEELPSEVDVAQIGTGEIVGLNRLLQTQLSRYVELLHGISDLADDIESLREKTNTLVLRAESVPSLSQPLDLAAPYVGLPDPPETAL